MKPLFGHAVRCIPVASTAAGFLVLAFLSYLRAADLPAPLTLDVPIPVNRALPAWLGQPDTPATVFGTLNLPLLTPAPSASLLVTVYFEEKESGFLRVIWKGTQGAQVLTDNFYENIGMANQRSLLISPDTLIGDGTLTFQASDEKLGIQRIKLEWLESKSALISPEIRDTLVTSISGQTRPSLELSGAPISAPPGAWDNQVVTVPMTDTAVRIEQGVDFSIDLDQAPTTARIALDEAGLPLSKRLVVWVNDQRAGTMTPAVPDLLDDGYLSSDAKVSYVGWRAASFYPPVSLLKVGVNAIQFSVEDDASPSTTPTADQAAPLAIKNLVMQLNYTPAGAVVPASAPTPIAAAPPQPDPAPVETRAVQTAAIAPLTTPPAVLAPVDDALPDLPLPQLMAPANPNLRSVESAP